MLVIFLPNLVWQAQHHFISLDFLKHIHVRDVSQGRARGFFVQQFCFASIPRPFRLCFWAYVLFRSREGKRYRALGWSYLATLALFMVAKLASTTWLPCIRS